MSDLLTKLGSKKGEGSSPNPTVASEPSTPVGSGAPTDNLNRGADLLSKAPVKESSATSKTEETVSKAVSEQAGDTSTVTDPSTWTVESALKEMKKTREEAKNTRIKYQEQIQIMKGELDTKLETLKTEYQDAVQAKKELEAIKAQEADKKRDLSEKLAHREATIEQLKFENDKVRKELSSQMENLKIQLGQLEAEKKAQEDVYRNNVKEELNKIPEQYREFAEGMVKGYSDPKEAYHMLTTARLKGMFEDKKIVVNHSVPDARTGARSTKERMESAAEEVRNNMSSAEKIKASLQAIRSGSPNPIFKGK